ncbi:MAG: protein YgfX [Pseudomonadales bacterium]
MFSPLNIRIKPSRYRRWLYSLALAAALGALCFTAAPWYIQLCLLFAVCVVGRSLFRKGVDWVLLWDVDAAQIKLARAGEPLTACRKIRMLYNVFYLLYLELELEGGRVERLLIFPDSVDPQSYRRLQVAVRWGSIK